MKFRSFPHIRAMAIALFPFRNPITEATACLGGNRDTHVYVVRHQVAFQDLALLLPRQGMTSGVTQNRPMRDV